MDHAPLVPETGSPSIPCVRIRPSVLAAQHGTETVLLDIESGRYFSLNEAGGRVWALLEQGTAVADIADRLEQEFDAPSATLVADVAALLSALSRDQLIESDGALNS